jgi:hypothetical protein
MSSEVLISFDTTGSMNPCIEQVRKHVRKTCDELFHDIPGLRIGIISHGDYCDGDKCISVLPLTDDMQKVLDFIAKAPATSGGDEEECYELVFNEAQKVGWKDDVPNKMFIIIGDSPPHPVGYRYSVLESNENKRNAVWKVNQLDWKQELAKLKDMGVSTYPLQCLARVSCTPFWQGIADLSGTPLLRLEKFAAASEILKGFAYASAGIGIFQQWESKLDDIKDVQVRNEAVKTAGILRAESLKYGK